jgi:hypothetical protein
MDGSKVILRRTPAGSNEHRITLYFSSPEMHSHPQNRTTPVIDIINLPSAAGRVCDVLLVTPYLRRFDTPPFHCYCEVLEAMRQFLQVEFIYNC